MEIIIAAIIIIALLLLLASCIRIVPQAQAYVIERLGAYQGTWSVGFHLKLPIVDKVAKKDYFKRAGCRFRTSAGYHKR